MHLYSLLLSVSPRCCNVCVNNNVWGQNQSSRRWKAALPSCSSSVSMRPRRAWIRRRTNCCSKPSERSFGTKQSSLLHTGNGFLRHFWLFSMSNVTYSFRWTRFYFGHVIFFLVIRINTIMDSDRVLVMHAGKMVEFDSPAVLCQADRSVFHRLVGQTAEWDDRQALWKSYFYVCSWKGWMWPWCFFSIIKENLSN